jgi:hypothetical protein
MVDADDIVPGVAIEGAVVATVDVDSRVAAHITETEPQVGDDKMTTANLATMSEMETATVPATVPPPHGTPNSHKHQPKTTTNAVLVEHSRRNLLPTLTYRHSH